MFWTSVGSGSRLVLAAAQVAGEDEPPVAAILAKVELDDRRTEDVPGVAIGQCHPRDDLARLVDTDPLEPIDHPLDVDQVEEGLGRLDVGMPHMGVAHLLALDPRTVAEHDAGDVAGGRRRIDRPIVSPLDQAGQAADVVVMGMRDDHRVEGSGVERELAVGAVGVDSVGIEQAAIEQETVGTDLQKMGAAGNLPGGAVERDSQPTPSRRSRDCITRTRVQIGYVLVVFPFSSLI